MDGGGGTGSPGSDTEDYWLLETALGVEHSYNKADVSWLPNTSYTASMRVKVNDNGGVGWNVALWIRTTLVGVDPFQGLVAFGEGEENDFEYHTWQIVYDAGTQECTGYKDGVPYPLSWTGDTGTYTHFNFGDGAGGAA